MNHRDLELLVVRPRLVELVKRDHRLESTDNQQAVDLVLGELRRDPLHVGIGEGTVRAEFGTAAGAPLVDAEPGKLGDVAFEETDETVVDCDGGVTVAEAVADGGTGGGVDSSGGSTGAGRGGEKSAHCSRSGKKGKGGNALDDTDTHALLLGNTVLGVEAGSSAESVKAVLELGVTQGESTGKVLSGNLLGDLLSLCRTGRDEHEKRGSRTRANGPEQRPPSRACG